MAEITSLNAKVDLDLSHALVAEGTYVYVNPRVVRRS